jgi:oligosaccharide repeat unit polymerase
VQTLLLFLCIPLCLLLSGWLYGDILSPIGVYGTTWFLALAVYTLPIMEFTPLSFPGWFAVLVSLAAFIGAGIAVALPYRKTVALQDRTVLNRLSLVDDRRFLRALAVLFAIGAIGYLLYLRRVAAVMGSVSAVWNNQAMILWHGVYGALRRLGIVGVLMGLLIPCFVLALYYVVKFRKAPLFVLLVLGTCLLTTLLSPSRTQWMTLVGWAFFLTASMLGSQRDEMKLVACAGAILVVFLGIFVVSSRSLGKGVYGEGSPMRYYTQLGDVWTWTLTPYLYVAGNFPALDRIVSEPSPYTRGSATFAPLQRVGNALFPSAFAYPEAVAPEVEIPIPMNTYTYLREFYLDFGWFGIVLFPFLTGLVTSYLYLAMRLRPTLFLQWTNALVLVCLVSTFNVNRFAWIATWQQMLTVLPVAWYAERRVRVSRTLRDPSSLVEG